MVPLLQFLFVRAAVASYMEFVLSLSSGNATLRQRRINVNATSRCINVMCPLGVCSSSSLGCLGKAMFGDCRISSILSLIFVFFTGLSEEVRTLTVS